MSYATVTVTSDGSLAFRSSYDPMLVGELKRLAQATGGKAFKSNSPGLLKSAVQHLLLKG